MTTAGVGALASVHALGLAVELSAVIAAVMVTQSNVGGSLKMAFEQFVGSVFGAAFAAVVILAIMPDDPLSSALALAVALAPLAVLAAFSAGFRIAPTTAAIVLLGGPGLAVGPVDLAADRILGVGLGCGVGLLVSVLVIPARASRSMVETAGRIARLLAEQIEALAPGDPPGQTELGSRAGEIRERFIQLAVFTEEAARERRAWLAEIPEGERLLRTLRRVRLDVDMLRRAARGAGNDLLHEGAAPSWQSAAESGAWTLRSISRLLAGEPVPEDLNALPPAVRDYRAALEDMRKAGVTRSLPTAALARLFGIGFALDQLRRDLDDLIAVSREVSSPRRAAPEGRSASAGRPSSPQERHSAQADSDAG